MEGESESWTNGIQGEQGILYISTSWQPQYINNLYIVNIDECEDQNL